MQSTCEKCRSAFEISAKDLEFYEILSPKIGGVIQQIPAPKLCSRCRFQRRGAQRNERNLYQRACSATGQSVVSILSPDKLLPVYHSNYWWSDKWDAKSYAIDFDFSRPFFEQWAQLRDSVPRLPLLTQNSENSDYTNHAGNNRDCFLSIIVFNCENVLYSRKVLTSRSILDCSYIFQRGELLYECFWGEDLYNCKFCAFCSSSSDLNFCYDCKGCRYCFMSSNLRSREFVFRGKQLSKSEYLEQISQITFQRRSTLNHLLREFAELTNKALKPALRFDHCEDADGDFLVYCKDVHECYFSAGGEGCRYCVEFDRSSGNKFSHYCMDCFGFGDSELLYEVQAQASGYNNKFCSWSYYVADSMYLDMCFNIKNCFGCVGLHAHEEYCILNKQFNQGDYEALVSRIISHMRNTGEWGEFFPAEFSLFGYNESVAQEYMPLTKEDALQQGFRWSDFTAAKPRVERVLETNAIPDDIADVDDSILSAGIVCEESGKLFRIVKPELEFYRAQNLPVPACHPDQRHLSRMRFKNVLKLFSRSCPRCSKEMVSSWPEASGANIVCNDCYSALLYSV